MSATFATHEVLNQPPELAGVNLFASDAALNEAVLREGGGCDQARLMTFGEVPRSGIRALLRLVHGQWP